MPKRRIPADAFEVYVALGRARSYEAVAARYGVSKRAVAGLAERDHWQDRLDEAERKAREESNRKAAETIQLMNDRHDALAQAIENVVVRLMQSRGPGTAAAVSGTEVRALAAAIESTQRIRRTARGLTGDESAKPEEPQAPAQPTRVIEWRLITKPPEKDAP